MHKSVLLDEVLQFLSIKPNGKYVDGTLGLGGHAEAIAKRLDYDGRLLGLDVDSQNLDAARKRLAAFGERVQIEQANFRTLTAVFSTLGWKEADGMLFDLGVASPHLDTPERGFSFQSTGPLDMRLDPTKGLPAKDLLSRLDEKKFEQILKDFGEERNARRLSRSILFESTHGRLQTTADLAAVCERVVGRHGKIHPATKVFLALRCLVNDELGALKDLLEAAPKLLAVGGRLAVISFHSIEDRLVKEKFRALTSEPTPPFKFTVLTKKPVEATDSEQQENPRSRSAKLRVLERAA